MGSPVISLSRATREAGLPRASWSTISTASLLGRPARPRAVAKRWARCQIRPAQKTLLPDIATAHGNESDELRAEHRRHSMVRPSQYFCTELRFRPRSRELTLFSSQHYSRLAGRSTPRESEQSSEEKNGAEEALQGLVPLYNWHVLPLAEISRNIPDFYKKIP